MSKMNLMKKNLMDLNLNMVHLVQLVQLVPDWLGCLAV